MRLICTFMKANDHSGNSLRFINNQLGEKYANDKIKGQHLNVGADYDNNRDIP